MSKLLANILLALAWIAATGAVTPFNFVVGLVLGYLVLYMASPIERRSPYFIKVWRVVSFAAFAIKELVKANLQMARWTVGRLDQLRPAILAVPLQADMTDTEITVLGNLITLTPGTLTLDVSHDRSVLFVHFMHVEDPQAEKDAIRNGFERRLLEITR